MLESPMTMYLGILTRCLAKRVPTNYDVHYPVALLNSEKQRFLEALAQELKELGGRYVLPFTFKNSSGTRTSHKLIFVSKSFKGYEIMKEIMAKESSTVDEGVPSFTYCPADASMPLLFSLAQPIGHLKESLRQCFAGRELTLQEIYEAHSVDTPYVKKNYREVIKQLEADNIVSARSTKGKRRAFTYPDHVRIKFTEGTVHGE